MVGGSEDGNNFPHKLLLTNTQISRICKAFVNGLSVNLKVLPEPFKQLDSTADSVLNLFSEESKNKKRIVKTFLEMKDLIFSLKK